MKRWVRTLFELEDIYIPSHHPPDVWETTFILGELYTKVFPTSYSSCHFNTRIITYTKGILDLLSRMDVLIYCLKTDDYVPDDWSENIGEPSSVILMDYLYNEQKSSYMDLSKVRNYLLKRLSLIYNLIVPSKMDRTYRLRYFTFLMEDIGELLDNLVMLEYTSHSATITE